MVDNKQEGRSTLLSSPHCLYRSTVPCIISFSDNLAYILVN